jgi:hypothetical protein
VAYLKLMNKIMNAAHKPRKVTVLGAVIVISAIMLTYWTAHGAADYIGAAGALCLLWTMLFDRPPGGAKTIAEVYRASRSGWRTSKSAKAMTLLGTLLVCVSFYMKFQP